jgi:putative transposase
MPNYRRWYQPGGTFFFTLTTHRRRPIFRTAPSRKLLGNAIRDAQRTMPFEIVAICLLPDHLHAVWSLPAGDFNYPARWKKIKADFTAKWLAAGNVETLVSASRRSKGERGVWQRRYWEHLIDDETDLENHVDYIHYNPVKHGYANRPWDWPYSSFRRFVDSGHYPQDWGRSEPENIAGLRLE